MREVISTVVDAAADYDLTDIATAKAELSIPLNDTTSDKFLAQAITQESKAISNYCNRVFPQETVSDLIYLDRSHSSQLVSGSVLQLSRYPVISVASVIEDAGMSDAVTLVSGTDFSLNAANGQLLRLDSSLLLRRWTAASITVQYDAGFSDIPDDLVMACLRLVTLRFKAKDRDPALMSEDSPGVGTQRWWVGSQPGQDGYFPPEVVGILDSYRAPTLG